MGPSLIGLVIILPQMTLWIISIFRNQIPWRMELYNSYKSVKFIY